MKFLARMRALNSTSPAIHRRGARIDGGDQTFRGSRWRQQLHAVPSYILFHAGFFLKMTPSRPGL